MEPFDLEQQFRDVVSKAGAEIHPHEFTRAFALFKDRSQAHFLTYKNGQFKSEGCSGPYPISEQQYFSKLKTLLTLQAKGNTVCVRLFPKKDGEGNIRCRFAIVPGSPKEIDGDN